MNQDKEYKRNKYVEKKIRLGDLIGNYVIEGSYWKEGQTPPFLMKLFTLFFFLFFGPFILLILNKKILFKIYFRTHINVFNPSKINIDNRLGWIIFGLFIWILTPFVIINNLIEYHGFNDRTYDWEKLTKSINEYGYNPDRFEGPITARLFYKIGKIGKYRIIDGNHRHKVLSGIYGADHKINVLVLVELIDKLSDTNEVEKKMVEMEKKVKELENRVIHLTEKNKNS